jgi:hypothetical protein
LFYFWMSNVEQHSSGTLNVKRRTTFIRYTQSQMQNNIHQVHSKSKVEQHSSGTLNVKSMLFYFWLWVYLINVVLLWTLSVPDECCSTFDFECTWWMYNIYQVDSKSKIEQHLSGTLNVKSRTTFIRYTQSQN